MSQNNVVNFKVDDDFLKSINQRAKELNLDRSAYLKSLIQKDLGQGAQKELNPLIQMQELFQGLERKNQDRYEKLRDALVTMNLNLTPEKEATRIKLIKSLFGEELGL